MVRLDDPNDTELLDLIPILIDLSESSDEVTELLGRYNSNPSAFLQRERATAIVHGIPHDGPRPLLMGPSRSAPL